MIIVGITGVIGSGKTTVCKLLVDLGYFCIDCDKIVHFIYKRGNEGYTEIKKHFGDAYINDFNVDTLKLSKLVFADDKARLKLNNLIHPLVEKQLKNELTKISCDIVFIEAPLLFESGIDVMCDVIIAVTCDNTIRLQRIILRDNCTMEEAEKRVAKQTPEKDLLYKSDYVIYNNDYCEMKNILLGVIDEIKKNKKF